MPDSLANFFKFQRKWPKNVVRRSPPNGPGVLHCERDSHVAGLISGRYPRPGMNRAVSPATPRSRGVRQAFNLVKLAEALIGMEKRGLECDCKAQGLVLAD